MKRIIRTFLVPAILALTLLSTSLVVFPPSVSAAAQVNSGPHVSFPVKGCAVTSIVLHGSLSPSVSCLRSKTSSKTVAPNAGVIDCEQGYDEAFYGAQGEVCFIGNGYMAIRITHLIA